MVKVSAHPRRLRHDRDIVRKGGDAQKASQNQSVVVADDPPALGEVEETSATSPSRPNNGAMKS
jgi:hypothetical protein